ncbi:hypothetical protein E2C01_089682 [Portunus trituberculatus]|uniref:Uncharacterized protein n=1 Tax=Portunus trituberculatus TaxID=210409 RepID=A0A5B7JCP6_PORTR|nr:hypothetical protein [Portunus trituberculatus]
MKRASYQQSANSFTRAIYQHQGAGQPVQ